MKKEVIDILSTFRLIMIGGIIMFNFCMYVTDTSIVKLGLEPEQLSYQFGVSMMYLSAMSILFLGTTLVNKLIYEEKKNRTIHVILSMGINPVKVWFAKMLVVCILAELYCIIAILSHIGLIYFIFGVVAKFSALTFIITFITIPILCCGFLYVISLAYMYFAKMNFVGMLIQIVPYIAVWNISTKLIQYTDVPAILSILTFAIGFILLFISGFIIKLIPKERIVTSVD